MTTNEQPSSQRNWRFYVGLILFILHLVLPILALIFVPLLGLSSGFNSILYGLSVVGGPDVLLLAATAMLGKENLEYLFSKLGSGFKKLVKWNQVSPRRYKTGLWLMCLSIATTFIFFYFLTETLSNGDQVGWGFYVTVGADFLFIISFFVLGSEFWAKIAALFQYNAYVVVEEKND